MGRQDYETETLIAHAIQERAVSENPDAGPQGKGWQANIAYTLEARHHVQAVAHSLRAEGFDASEDGTGRGTPIVPVAFGWQGAGKQTALGASTKGTGALGTTKIPAIAFSAKDHGADAGDIAPTLRAGGHAKSHANGGVMPAVAVDVYNQTIDGDIAATLNAESGAPNHSGPKIMTTSVRRLTPRECERLQGFPDVKKSASIRVWYSEHLKNAALAATKNHKSHPFASSAAASANQQSANHAAGALNANHPDQEKHAAVLVRIDLERGHLQIRNAEKLIWSASIAEKPSASPLLMPIDAFALLLAHMPQCQGQETHHGAGASPQNTTPSTPRWSGSALVHLCGQEIVALANDAGRFTTTLNRCIKSTTLAAGPSSQNSGLTLETWSCCVAAAIISCIPEQIRAASSFDLRVETTAGWTLVPYRNKPAADGPRYKALGNSMAVPCMRWLGERIAMVENLA